jgi:hypothetical protein
VPSDAVRVNGPPTLTDGVAANAGGQLINSVIANIMQEMLCMAER